MKMKTILVSIVLSSSFLFLPGKSFALELVYDAASFGKLVQEFEQLQKQYDLLHQTYENATEQLKEAQKLRGDAEGNYGYGNVLNGNVDLKNREWSPDDWQSALQGLSGGNPDRYQQLVSQYQQNNPTLSDEDYKKGASDANALVYQQQVQTNQAVTVNTTYEFNDIKTHLENIHQISTQIESAQNEKAAIDLSTRMQAEMAYVQVQELKQITLLNEQIARSNADDIASETQNAKFNTVSDN